MELYAQSGLRLALPRRQRTIQSFFQPANRLARVIPDPEAEVQQFADQELVVQPLDFVAEAQEEAIVEQQETVSSMDEQRLDPKEKEEAPIEPQIVEYDPLEVDPNQVDEDYDPPIMGEDITFHRQRNRAGDLIWPIYEQKLRERAIQQESQQEEQVMQVMQPYDNAYEAEKVAAKVIAAYRKLNYSGGSNNSIGLAAIKRIINQMHAIVPFTKDSIFFDMGCGAGVPGYYVNTRFGCKCAGFDYDPILIEIAKKWQKNFSTRDEHNGSYDNRFYHRDFMNITVQQLQQSQVTHVFCFDGVFEGGNWDYLFQELLGKCGIQGLVGCSVSVKQNPSYFPDSLVRLGKSFAGKMMGGSGFSFRCWQYQEDEPDELDEPDEPDEQPKALIKIKPRLAPVEESESDSEVIEIVPPKFVQVSKGPNAAVQEMHNESPLYYDAIQRPDLLAQQIAYFNKTHSDFEIKDTPPYGKGLFALKPIGKDREIGLYYGVVIPNELAARLPSAYVKIAEISPSHKKGTMSICADMVHIKDSNQFNYVAFANDPGYVVKNGELIGPAQRENAKLLTAPLGSKASVHLVAKRDIQAGEEILTFYGEPYWDPAQNPDGEQYYAVRNKFYADKAKKKGKK